MSDLKLEASSFELTNSGTTIFTITKPGGTTDTIHPAEKIMYTPHGVYSVHVDSVLAFTVNFIDGNLNIAKSTDSSPAGTAANVNTIMN